MFHAIHFKNCFPLFSLFLLVILYLVDFQTKKQVCILTLVGGVECPPYKYLVDFQTKKLEKSITVVYSFLSGCESRMSAISSVTVSTGPSIEMFVAKLENH